MESAFIAAVYKATGIEYTLFITYRHKRTAKKFTTSQPVENFQHGKHLVGSFQTALKLKY